MIEDSKFVFKGGGEKQKGGKRDGGAEWFSAVSL